MAEESRVSLLWSCAKELTTQTHAERLLKSYYINTSRKLAKHNVQLPEDCVGPGRMCARCGNQWSDGNYQLHLKPQRLANNAKRRRLIAQLDVIKAKQPKGSGRLSTAARKRAKWIKKRMCSGVAVDCAVCKHKTVLPLEKPKKRSKSAVTSETTTTTTVTPETAKKKKKKKKKQAPNNNKDINAGLKLAKPQKQQQTTPTAAAAAPTKTPSKAAATTKTTATTTAAATAAKSNKQKKKSKAAQPKATPTPTPAAKVQSKTQKQNALLQLAAQLKLHASKNASKTQQNRLQAFLK